MYIKWKYNDHGHPDFKEVEIPDDLDGWASVEAYICDQGWVPTWSERFMKERIKWEKVDYSPIELVQKAIDKNKNLLEIRQKEIEEMKKNILSLESLLTKLKKQQNMLWNAGR